MGNVYQPKLKSGGRSARWVITYYVPGKGKVHGAPAARISAPPSGC
jgi:hypothetical protein